MLVGLVSAQDSPSPRIDARRNPLVSPIKRLPGVTKGTGATPPPAAPAMPRPSAPSPAAAIQAAEASSTGSSSAASRITPFEAGVEFEAVPSSTRVTFNLEDADLPDLVRLISSLTGKRFILPGSKARSIKATVFAPTKVTVAEAYQAFLSILQINGMTVVPSGRYLKILDSAGVETQPLAPFADGDSMPADDRFVTRMHRLDSVGAEDVSTLLARFKSREGNITAYAPTNTLIITDTGANIRRMLRIVEAIDVPRAGEQVWIEPIHYATATELAERLTAVFPPSEPGAAATPAAPTARVRPTPPPAQPAEGGEASSGPTTVGARIGEMRITKILPDERTNSIIIVATERAYMRILEMIRELDTPLEGEGRVHVHAVQHGDAEDLAQALSTLIGTGGGSAAPTGGAQNAAAARASASPFEGQVRVTAHKSTNSLVITSTLHDYASLRGVIERLDRPRRQVFIEAVIMELQIDRSSKLGLNFHAGVPNTLEDGDVSIFGFGARDSIGFPASQAASQDALTGLALGVRGPIIPQAQQLIGMSVPSFGAVLTALASSGDVNVLSTPHIMAMDNVEAEISVGENIALQQNAAGFGGGTSALSGLAGAAGGANSAMSGLGAASLLGGLGGGLGGMGGFGNAQRQDVGTKIKIIPHVNADEEIRLEIDEEISEAGSPQGALGVVPLSKRTAKTEVVVRDQQTIVIGGLMRDRVSTTETKIPILGDIPLLGMLFRRTDRTTRKTNLLLFLTPYIIRSPEDLRAIFERKMRERQDFIDRFFVFGDQEYSPTVDYSRTRGLVAEINMELDRLAEEEAARLEAEGRPPPSHRPRAALGSIPMEGDGGGPEAGEIVIGPNGVEPQAVEMPTLPPSIENEQPPAQPIGE